MTISVRVQEDEPRAAKEPCEGAVGALRTSGSTTLKPLRYAAAVLAVAVMAVPAAATDGTASSQPVVEPTETTTEPAYVPNTPLTDVYFLCDGETKEGTVNALSSSHYSSWDTTKPSGSVTGGQGCGQADEGVFGGIRPKTPYEFSAVGFYTGNLDSLTFHMHDIFVGQRRLAGASTVDVRVLVDGKSLFGNASTTNAAGTVSTEPADRRLAITPVGTGTTGAAALYEATVTGIDMLNLADNVEHEVVFNITTTEPLNVWAWGNTEAPSGITFNPTAPAKVVTAAVAHDQR